MIAAKNDNKIESVIMLFQRYFEMSREKEFKEKSLN